MPCLLLAAMQTKEFILNKHHHAAPHRCMHKAYLPILQTHYTVFKTLHCLAKRIIWGRMKGRRARDRAITRWSNAMRKTMGMVCIIRSTQPIAAVCGRTLSVVAWLRLIRIAPYQ